jgi:class 3 adenylate cyclase/tetratricopeptide (TPR) repeat protein
MKLLLIIIILIFSINTTIAQLQGQTKIDSLLKELPKMKEDTNGVNLLYNLSNEYSINKSEKGLKYAKEGLKLSQKLNWKLGEGKLNFSLGLFFKHQGKYPEALGYFEKSLNIMINLKNELNKSKLLGVIGDIYSYQGNYPNALKYSLQSLKIRENIEDNKGVINILNKIGGIYHRLSKQEESIKYFKKALDVAININDSLAMNIIYVNLAGVYKSVNKNDSTIFYLIKSLKYFEKTGEKEYISLTILNLASEYHATFDYNNAIIFFEKAIRIFRENRSKSNLATSLGNLGLLYTELAQDSILAKYNNDSEIRSLKKEVNLNKAINYLNESIDILNEIEEIHKKSFFLNYLSNAYTEKGDYKKAYETYKEHNKLNDSIFSSKNQTKIANLEAKRENELKEKEIVILKKEKENQKLQRYAMFGGIVGLGIIIGLILIQRRKSEKLLLNVLPEKIAKRLKAKEHPIADHFDNASIIFIDLVSFTKMSSRANPKEIVALLNDIFTIFDKLADKHGLEKIKTIGDAYMAVAGIPEIQNDHSKRTAQMALDIKSEMKDFKTSDGTEIKFRIGIDCGAVVAGVIGEKKFIYDLWSDAVNTASRMESTGESGQIQITDNFKSELEKFEGNWNFTFRGEFEIKGKGLMKTYFLEENNLGEL